MNVRRNIDTLVLFNARKKNIFKKFDAKRIQPQKKEKFWRLAVTKKKKTLISSRAHCQIEKRFHLLNFFFLEKEKENYSTPKRRKKRKRVRDESFSSSKKKIKNKIDSHTPTLYILLCLKKFYVYRQKKIHLKINVNVAHFELIRSYRRRKKKRKKKFHGINTKSLFIPKKSKIFFIFKFLKKF